VRIVCLGDSLTKGYRVKASQAWPALLSKETKIEVINKGINGDTTAGMLARFNHDVINSYPSHVIIMGGVNDMTLNTPLSVIKANVAAMIQQAYHNNIIPVIGISTPIVVDMAQKYWPVVDDFNSVVQMLNENREWVLKFSRYFGVQALDFYNRFCQEDIQSSLQEYFLDGLHPTAEGHEIMYQQARGAMKLL
jgi:acyl-CoA thioesterase I